MKTVFITLLFSIVIFTGNKATAQAKTKDGTVTGSSNFPDANAVLELESANKGLLLPRVALTALDAAAPLGAHTAGMTVYNTATAGSGANAVTPGYYYNDGTKWVRVTIEPWHNTKTKTAAMSNTDSVYILGKAGIGIDTATAWLDVNGNLRVRNVPPSTNTGDINLVVDSSGYVKGSLKDSRALMRGYLGSDFSSGSSSTSIYKVTSLTEVQDPGSDYNTATYLFTAPVTGLYHIELTTTAISLNTNPEAYVFGLVNSSTDKWVLRFSLDDDSVEGASSAGLASTFSGVAELTAGQQYYFGISYYTRLVAKPSGNTGTGIGSYFEIELLKN